MDVSHLTNLEIWNISGKMATASYQAAYEDRSLVDAKEEHEYIPFWSKVEIRGVYEEIDEDTKRETTRAFRKIIQSRVQEQPPIEEQVAESLAMLFIDDDAEDYRQVMSQFEQVDSFPPKDVASDEVSNVQGSTRSERVDEIADWVATWIGESNDDGVPDDVEDEEADQSIENDADDVEDEEDDQSIESGADGVEDECSDHPEDDIALACKQVAYEGRSLVGAKEEYPNIPFWSKVEIRQAYESIDQSSTERLSTFRNLIRDRIENPPSLKEQIAESLAMVFIDRDADSYRDVMGQFDQVDSFPMRQVAMVEVVNATGSNRNQRVAAIVDWVQTWYDDPDEAVDMNRERPYPMGMKPSN